LCTVGCGLFVWGVGGGVSLWGVGGGVGGGGGSRIGLYTIQPSPIVYGMY